MTITLTLKHVKASKNFEVYSPTGNHVGQLYISKDEFEPAAQVPKTLKCVITEEA